MLPFELLKPVNLAGGRVVVQFVFVVQGFSTARPQNAPIYRGASPKWTTAGGRLAFLPTLA